MVIDKFQYRARSLPTHRINQHSNSFYYRFHTSNKDYVYLIAWLMLDRPYHLIQHHSRLLEATMFQRDPDGVVLLQRTATARSGPLTETNPRIDGSQLEAECRALLAELAALWDGQLWNPPCRW